jgi:hypothetical protein
MAMPASTYVQLGYFSPIDYGQDHCIFLKSLKPMFLDDLIRLGLNCDGGYVVNERAVRDSKYMMSFGVGHDWSFELELLDRNPEVEVFCFDPSVSKAVFRQRVLNALNELFSFRSLILILLRQFGHITQKVRLLKFWIDVCRSFSVFTGRDNVHFYQRGIWSELVPQFLTFADAFRLIGSEHVPDDSVFVKLDIEQSEFRVIPSLLSFTRYINCLVIEFHELDILWPQFMELVRTIQADFQITHVHGNNYAGLIPNSRIPIVLEITFLKKQLINESRPTRENVTYPIPHLDYPNNGSKEDYPLDGIWNCPSAMAKHCVP